MVDRAPAIRWRFLSLICLTLVVGEAASAQGKKKSSAAQAASEYAVVSGTVFRDSGLALPEAEVTLEVVQDPPVVSKSKMKKLKAMTSPRGEFAFRVPPVAMKYRVAVSARGFQAAEKVVEVQGGSERVDATFSLSPESKH